MKKGFLFKSLALMVLMIVINSSAAWADGVLLPGEFSVSATKKVKFTKGNLYWNGSGSAWALESSQTDYPTEWSISHVGHLFWTKTAAASYADAYDDGELTKEDVPFFAESKGGLTVEGQGGLYALSKDEWSYLISKRTNASILCKSGVTVTNAGTEYAKCIIIAPDDYTGTPLSEITDWSLSNINTLGLVCLPAAGSRDGKTLNAGKSCNYWSASPSETKGFDSGGIWNQAYSVYGFNTVSTSNKRNRGGGYSVRLVKNIVYDDRIVVNTTDYPEGCTLTAGKTYTAAPFEGNGGVAYVNEGGNLTGSNVSFASNSDTGSGGAIHNYGKVTLADATFANNSASSDGGALYSNQGTVTLAGATFRGNTAGSDGGAVYNTSDGTVTINGETTFSANTATLDGGAIYNTGTVNLNSKTTFSGNTATLDGGAIYNTGTVNMADSVILETSADKIYNGGTLNWDLTGTKTGKLINYQYLTNNGGKLTFTVKADQTLGDYVIATGDFDMAKLTANNSTKFYLATGTDSIAITVDGGMVAHGKVAYKLALKESTEAGKDQLVLSAVLATKIGDKTYGSLADALANVKKGETITLCETFSEAADLSTDCNNFTIDMNGNSYTNTNSLSVVEGLTVVDSKVGSKAEFKLAKIGTNENSATINLNGVAAKFGAELDDKLAVNVSDTTSISMLDGTQVTLNGYGDNITTLADGTVLTTGTNVNATLKAIQNATVTLEGGAKFNSMNAVNLQTANLTLTGTGTELSVNTGAGATVDGTSTLTIKDNAKLTADKEISNNGTVNVQNGGTLKTTSQITNNGTLKLSNGTLDTNGSYYVNNSGVMNVTAGTSKINSNAFQNASNGTLNLEKDAVLSFTNKKSITNNGTINLKGGKTADDVTIDGGTVNWDITDKIATKLNWATLSNTCKPGIVPGLAQPKDTVYVLANGLQGDAAPVFTLTGISGRDDQTVTTGGKCAFYGNRSYRLYLEEESMKIKERNGGKVRPTIKKTYMLKLEIKPGVCRNKDTEALYETLDDAIANVQPGQTIELLGDIEMENDLEMPANTYLDLNGCTLTNPQGLDLTWDLTSDKAPVIQDFDKLNAQGTLTLNVYDMQTRKDYVIAQDAAESAGRVFTLPGDAAFDKNARTLTVNGGKVFYGHRFYSLALNSNNEIVLTVEKVIPANNEFWAVATGDTKLTLGSTQGYGAGNTGSTLVAEDALTRFEFDSDVTRIALAALENNEKLKEVYFPASVESVGQYAFEDCKNLEYVSTGENLEKINDRAFNGCTKLQFIDLEDNKQLKEIAAYAFGGSEALKSVTLPASVEYIGSRAFYGCKNLTSVTLLGTDPEAINMTAESFKGMAEDASVFVNSDKLLTFEAYNYGKGINFQTKKAVEITWFRTGFFCHHNMIVPEGLKALPATWNGTGFVIGSPIDANSIVPGGKGYILEGGAGEYVVETTSKDATVTVDNDLTGVMEKTSTDELSKLGKVYEVSPAGLDALTEVTSSGHLDGYTACAVINVSNTPLVKLFDFDSWYYGWATGIQTPSEVRSEELGVRSYNISGQQVGNEYKGVVIKNGKKYLNK